VTLVSLDTGWVVTVKLTLEDPSGTVTFAGVAATEGLPLDRVTSAPPGGAAPVRVTVPVAELPPPTVLGFTASDDNVTGGLVTVNVAFRIWPPSEPEMVTSVDEPTEPVFTVKFAVLDPGETTTAAGTAATEVLLLESGTTAPLGAGVLRVTVPVEVPPLPTLAGSRLKEEIEMALEAPWFTVTKARFVMLPP
jgi:hypothetical protein